MCWWQKVGRYYQFRGGLEYRIPCRENWMTLKTEVMQMEWKWIAPSVKPIPSGWITIISVWETQLETTEEREAYLDIPVKCRMTMIPKLDVIMILGYSRWNISMAGIKQFRCFIWNVIYNSNCVQEKGGTGLQRWTRRQRTNFKRRIVDTQKNCGVNAQSDLVWELKFVQSHQQHVQAVD